MPAFLKEIRAHEVMDNFGLLLIGLVSFGYVLFYRPFAKLHLDLPVLNIPVFIGEILFIICSTLVLPKAKALPKRTIYLLIAYIVFIIVKTLAGYVHWGPLAFRHAALFYYPLFAVFSYSFFRKDLFSNKLKVILIILLLLMFKFVIFYYYFILTCSILVLILIKSYSGRKTRYLFYLALLLAFPYRFFFETARTFMVSGLVSLLFILIFLLCILKLKKGYKLLTLFIFTAFIVVGSVKIANKDHLKSLMGFGELQKRYNARKMLIQELGKSFVAKKYKINLYNPVYEDRAKPDLDFRKIQELIDQTTKPENENKPQIPAQSVQEPNKNPSSSVSMPESSKPEEPYTKNNEELVSGQDSPLLTKVPEKRDLETDYANSLFRIFIWQDALNDIMNYKPVFGFDFGRPFLSRSLEVTNWAISDWGRDGWVCFHNGYLDIIYRSGMLSLVFFCFIFSLIFIMVKKSFQIKSVNGILLAGALINWFVAANFLEILEMPYTAIPLWSLFGVTWAYLFKNKTS